MPLEEVRAILTSGIQGIAMIIEKRIKDRNNDSIVNCVSWKDDENIKNTVTGIKNNTEVVSNSCVKLTLLIKAKYSSNDLNSLLSELQSQLQSVMGLYYILVEYKICDSLFDYASRVVRSLLGNVNELLSTVSSNPDHSTANYITGVIQDINAEAQKIPLSNRVAYRRQIMQNCIEIKSTIDEFQGYIEEAHEKGITSRLDNLKLSSNTTVISANDADSDDSDDGNIDYTPVELRYVESCVELMNSVLQLVKLSLAIITEVSDKIHNLSHHTSTTNDNGGAVGHVFSTISATTIENECQEWLALLVKEIVQLNTNTLNLGAELYPPFGNNSNDISTIGNLKATLTNNAKELLLLLNSTTFISYYSDEHKNNQLLTLFN